MPQFLFPLHKCHNFFHFTGAGIPGTSDDSGVHSMGEHDKPHTELSNVSKQEYFGCFQDCLCCSLSFGCDFCIKLSTVRVHLPSRMFILLLC